MDHGVGNLVESAGGYDAAVECKRQVISYILLE
jgi:hypothetical protein